MMHEGREFVEDEGMISYGPDMVDNDPPLGHLR
jgi:hypothetical protein